MASHRKSSSHLVDFRILHDFSVFPLVEEDFPGIFTSSELLGFLTSGANSSRQRLETDGPGSGKALWGCLGLYFLRFLLGFSGKIYRKLWFLLEFFTIKYFIYIYIINIYIYDIIYIYIYI